MWYRCGYIYCIIIIIIINQHVAAGNHINVIFYVRYKGFFMELHGFLCRIDAVSRPVRLHYLLQV